MAGGVVDQHRGIGVLAAVEEARAVDRELGPGAVAAHEQLVAHDMAAGDEAHVGKPRMGADRRAHGREVQGVAAFRADLDVVERGPLAELEVERGIDLVIDPVGALMALEQGERGAGADRHQRARVHGGGAGRSVGVDEMQRPRRTGVLRDLDDRRRRP